MDTGILTQVELLPHDPVDGLARTSQTPADISFSSQHNPLILQRRHAETDLSAFRGTYDPRRQQLLLRGMSPL